MPSSYRVHKMPGILPGGKIKTAKPRRFVYRGWFWLFVLGSGLYWFLFHSPQFAVTAVEMEGSDEVALKTMAEGLKGKNIFSLRQTTIESAMQQAYPPVSNVTVVRGVPHTIRITVTLREPSIRWQVKDQLYILDSSGYVFGQGDKPEYAALPKVVDASSTPVQLGQQITAPAFVQFMSELQTKLVETFKRPHVATEITETTFHVDALLEGDIRLRFTVQRPLEEQLTAASTLLAAHPEAKMIDVRVPKWGYWK